ncbi:MAG: threonine aldolase family protein [Nannocystaceae bacterium]
MGNLRSDNNAGLCPEAAAALQELATGFAVGYGDDAITGQAIAAFRKLFGEQTAVFFVATGTAANTLAIASMTEPWQRVLCHSYSHYNDDESTAPERITLCRTTAIAPTVDPSRITLADLDRATTGGRGDVHEPAPGVVTLTNVTELGTVYDPKSLTELCKLAHERGYRVHVDGARFANAVASVMATDGLDATTACRALSVDAGVDALTFGGTKNGFAFGEAVLLFPQNGVPETIRACERFPFLRKSTGHLLSKHRFVSGQFLRTLADERWLAHARHANQMAAKLGAGLARQGFPPAFPVEANGVFVKLPDTLDQGLQAAGHGYYPFSSSVGTVARLMSSYATLPEDIDDFLADVERLAPR